MGCQVDVSLDGLQQGVIHGVLGASLCLTLSSPDGNQKKMVLVFTQEFSGVRDKERDQLKKVLEGVVSESRMTVKSAGMFGQSPMGGMGAGAMGGMGGGYGGYGQQQFGFGGQGGNAGGMGGMGSAGGYGGYLQDGFHHGRGC